VDGSKAFGPDHDVPEVDQREHGQHGGQVEHGDGPSQVVFESNPVAGHDQAEE
jgi:hypothetical protein